MTDPVGVARPKMSRKAGQEKCMAMFGALYVAMLRKKIIKTYFRLPTFLILDKARSASWMDFCTFFNLSDPECSPPGPMRFKNPFWPWNSAIS